MLTSDIAGAILNFVVRQGRLSKCSKMTVFENDMTLYKGTIPAMQSVPLVISIEVEDADAANLSSISLNLKNDSKTYTIQLL